MYLLALMIWAFITPEPLPEKISQPVAVAEDVLTSEQILYDELGLSSSVDFKAFSHAINGIEKYHPRKRIVAIADFTKTSDQKRLFIIDVDNRVVLLNTWVAHGRNTGENTALNFSNKPQSFMSSPGFYMVNDEIVSPKHGAALLLEGLEKDINDNARSREIIIHGADYVCEEFIKKHGRIGRSHGCPAVSRDEMKKVIDYLAGGTLLYIHKMPS